MELEEIKKLVSEEKIEVTRHVQLRLYQREITLDQVVEAIKVGKIIERYPDDTPTPSFLILGFLEENKPLHVVCGLGEVLWFITAYWPSLEIWEQDFETRREKS